MAQTPTAPTRTSTLGLRVGLFTLLLLSITSIAYFGLQLHEPSHGGETPLEWVCFLGSIAACTTVLLFGGRRLSRPPDTAAPRRDGLEG